MRITAAVCTYSRYDLLHDAVASLTTQTLAPGQYEIIVVDNTPADRRRDPAGAGVAHLRWLWEATPGLSRARNRASAEAAAPIIAFLDDDAVAEPTWLARIVQGFDRFGPAAAALGGRVDPRWGLPRPRWLHDDLLGYLSVVNWGGPPRVLAEGEWLAGTNIAFRRDDLAAAGGFSTALGRHRDGLALLSNEESEVVGRLTAAGRQVVYDPQVGVQHLIDAGRLTQPWLRRRAAWQATSDFLLDPTRRIAQAEALWQGLLSFVNGLPPRDRSLRALYVPMDDPDQFKAQIAAVYCYTISLLSGFAGVRL